MEEKNEFITYIRNDVLISLLACSAFEAPLSSTLDTRVDYAHGPKKLSPLNLLHQVSATQVRVDRDGAVMCSRHHVSTAWVP